MIPATAADRSHIVDILARSFAGNHSVRYVVRPGRHQQRRIRALMAYAFDRCLRFGKVYLSEERTACALVLLPGRQHTTPATLLADLQLALNVIGLFRIRKTLRRERQIKSNYRHQQRYYVWFIGVLPESQHRGTGSRLLQELIRESSSMGRPLYLETSMPENLAWYERHGLTCYAQLQFDRPLYLFCRHHDAASGR